MSRPVPVFPNVGVIDANYIKDNNLLKSTYNYKSILINEKFKIETRTLPNDFHFEDKNLQLLLKKTDIKANEYEGGLKIWECSIDLSQCIINSFVKNNKLKTFVQFVTCCDSCNLLELGCGHSLPSITFVSIVINSLNEESKQENQEKENEDGTLKIMLCLQDLNKDVLQHISIPNVCLNCKEWIHSKEFYKSFKGVCGDWRDMKLTQNLLNITQNKKKNEYELYDVIFASETIYNKSMIETLLDLLMNLLSKPNGICFISAKSYYFGIANPGGTQALKLFMQNEKNNTKYPFDIHTIQRIDDGISNMREIIILTWKGKCEWDLSSIWTNINDFDSEEEADEEDIEL